MPIQAKKISLLLLAILSIVAAAFIGITISNDASELNQIWQVHSEKEVEKSNALTEIIIGFGYGGFIHDFKNLILRQDTGYALAAQSELDKTYTGINTYLAIETDESIKEEILIFKKTVDEYSEKFQLVNQLIKEKKSIREIDQLVQVDDREGVAALEKLLSSIRETTQSTLTLSEEKMATFQELIRNGFIFIIFCLITSAVVIALNFRSIFSAYKEISILFSAVPNAIIVTDPSGFVTRANSKAIEIFGYTRNEFKNKSIESFIPIRYRKNHIKQRTEFQKSDGITAMDNRNKSLTALRKNGEEFPVNISISTYHDTKGKHSIAVISDISLEKKLEEEATKDHLTNIANRKKCFEFLSNSINQARRYQHPLSVIMCDIDYFKKINDDFGHNTGDDVLIKVSNLLKRNIRETDLLARWGGEEFLIICPDTSKDNAYIMAEHLRSMVKNSFEKTKTPVTMSLGVTEFKADDDKEDMFIERADTALYESKNNGRNQTNIH